MIRVCPKCDVGLFIAHLHEIEVDYCDRCRGLWLDAGELEALLERSGGTANEPVLKLLHQATDAPAAKRHLCPRCDQFLLEVTIPTAGGTGLTLDRCPCGHGLWFDADELQQLLAFSPASPAAARAIEYLNEIFAAKPQT